MSIVTETAAAPSVVAHGSGDAAGGDPVADIEQQFIRMHQRVKVRLRERADQLHPGLSPLGLQLIRAIEQSGPLHAGRVAELLGLDKSIVSRQAAALAEAGLLERRHDSADRRAVYLDLTPEARERLGAIRRTDARELRSALTAWDERDLATLATLLERMNDTLEAALP